MVRPEDEVFAITSAGGVIRTAAAEIKQSGRQTMGVRLMNLADGQSLVAIARNAESASLGEVLDAGDMAADESFGAADAGEAPEAGPAAADETGGAAEVRSADTGAADPADES